MTASTVVKEREGRFHSFRVHERDVFLRYAADLLVLMGEPTQWDVFDARASGGGYVTDTLTLPDRPVMRELSGVETFPGTSGVVPANGIFEEPQALVCVKRKNCLTAALSVDV